MNNIDNGHITFENIVGKTELIKIIILQLNSDLKQDLTTDKERSTISHDIQRIQMRLNNYQNKYNRWMTETINYALQHVFASLVFILYTYIKNYLLADAASELLAPFP